MTGNGRKPWHRLPDETIEAYLAFCIFLNLGSQRSLHKVAQEIDGKTMPVEILNGWADRFEWNTRAELCEQRIEEEFRINNVELLNNSYDFDESLRSPRVPQRELVYSAQRG